MLGYFIGNALPIIGGTTLPASQTTITTTQPQQTSGAGGLVQFTDPFDDDPVIGDKNSKIIFIEFSDFQCPFCRRFWTESLSQLENEYIKTGQVVFVYRDFPLDSIHPGATPAAVAAECANEQGKWREMHDTIFGEQNKQGTGTIDFNLDDLKQWATLVSGLDLNQFNQCLDTGKYLQEVQKDFQDGINAGVGGTPTFFIGTKEKGFTAVVGAQPYSVLKQVVEQQLA